MRAFIGLWIAMSCLWTSGCTEEPIKDGGLCNADDECVNENCGPGVCSSSAVCSSDDDCDPDAYCRATYNYCARPCSAGCGDSTCIDSLGICSVG